MKLYEVMKEIKNHNKFVFFSIIICPLVAVSYVLVESLTGLCQEKNCIWYVFLYDVSLAIFASDLFYLMQSYFPSRERLHAMEKFANKDGIAIANKCNKLVYLICNCASIKEKVSNSDTGEYDKIYLNSVWNEIKDIQQSEATCKVVSSDIEEIKENIREYSIRYNAILSLEDLALLRKIEDSFFMYIMPYIADKRLKGVKETVKGTESLYEFCEFAKQLKERCSVMGETKEKKTKKEVSPYVKVKKNISSLYKNKKLNQKDKYIKIKEQVKSFSLDERKIYKLEWISYTAGPTITEFAGTVSSLVFSSMALIVAILALDKQLNFEVTVEVLIGIEAILALALLGVLVIRWDGGKASKAAYLLEIINHVDAEENCPVEKV